MGQQIENLTFEGWMSYVFDHPLDDQKLEWYWDIDRDWWSARDHPAHTLQFLTQAFENAEVLFQPYDDAQLNQGLWFIGSNSCSDHMLALMSEDVPWPAQKRCIHSFHQLFEGCFAKRCSPHLSHIDEPGANPLNSACYMWWDILPFYGRPEEPAWREFDQEILQVMESTLQLDSIACRESALHGLGHWQPHYPEQVGEIIDQFSMSHTDLPEKLQEYMMNAYVGYVL